MNGKTRRSIMRSYVVFLRAVYGSKHKVSDRKVQGIHKRGEMNAIDFAKEMRG